MPYFICLFFACKAYKNYSPAYAGSIRRMQGANSPCRKYGLVPVGVPLRYTLVLARNISDLFN